MHLQGLRLQWVWGSWETWQWERPIVQCPSFAQSVSTFFRQALMLHWRKCLALISWTCWFYQLRAVFPFFFLVFSKSQSISGFEVWDVIHVILFFKRRSTVQKITVFDCIWLAPMKGLEVCQLCLKFTEGTAVFVEKWNAEVLNKISKHFPVLFLFFLALLPFIDLWVDTYQQFS